MAGDRHRLLDHRPMTRHRMTQRKRFIGVADAVNATERASLPATDLTLINGTESGSPWISGKIDSMPGYSFHAKLYDQPSKFGIEGGKVSKLQVRKDGEQALSYDRGWDQKPTTSEDREALRCIRAGLGDTPNREFKGAAIQRGKDDGIDL